MWWDPHLGIYHVRHRAYDPRLGRFLQPDPIGVAGGWNVFEYVGGDPANYVDPSGLRGAPPGYPKNWPHDPARRLEPVERDLHQGREAAFAWGREVAGHVRIGTEFSLQAAGVVAIVVIPGPEDVLLAAALSKHGLAALRLIGDELVGLTKSGDAVKLADDAAKEIVAIVKTETPAAYRTIDGPKDVWKKKPFDRGNELDQFLKDKLPGESLCGNFKTIDNWDRATGTATSIKSLDLAADTYQDAKKLEDKIGEFADDLAAWLGQPTAHGGVRIPPSQVKDRRVLLALPYIPSGPQADAIGRAVESAKKNGISIDIVIVK